MYALIVDHQSKDEWLSFSVWTNRSLGNCAWNPLSSLPYSICNARSSKASPRTILNVHMWYTIATDWAQPTKSPQWITTPEYALAPSLRYSNQTSKGKAIIEPCQNATNNFPHSDCSYQDLSTAILVIRFKRLDKWFKNSRKKKLLAFFMSNSLVADDLKERECVWRVEATALMVRRRNRRKGSKRLCLFDPFGLHGIGRFRSRFWDIVHRRTIS